MEKIANVFVGASMFQFNVIEHEGALWIVNSWMKHKSRPVKRPARLVRLSGLKYQEMDAGKMGADYLVNYPIPDDVMSGQATAEQAAAQGFIVLDTPPIEIEIKQPH